MNVQAGPLVSLIFKNRRSLKATYTYVAFVAARIKDLD